MSTPNCPQCNDPMILRTKKGSNYQFYGCSNFPKCKGFKPFVAPKLAKNVQTFEGIKGSEQQEAFWNAVKTTVSHLILKARAGTGKTFTIVYLLSFLKGLKIYFAAFNSHIAKELESRVPEGISVSTVHSFGLKQIKRWNPKVMIDKDKLYNIIDEYVNKEDENADYIKNTIAKLVDLCKYNLYDGRNEAQLDELVIKHGIDLNDHRSQIYTLVPQIINTSKTRKNVIDFTDMLWFVYAHNIAVEQYDLFVGDEIQDWNRVQQYVVLQAIKNGGRFIGVGDDRQAIYGFAGADVRSMDTLYDLLKNTQRGIVVMPLTFTRRSPVSHVDLAKNIVSDIEAMDSAEIGSVESITINLAITNMKASDMGICRRNAPLIKTAYALIQQGKAVLVRGRDIGEGLQALIRKFKATDIPMLIEKAELYRAKELDKLTAQGKKGESRKQSLNDRIDTLIALTEGMNDLSELKAKINHLFSDDTPNNKIILSTVHRAKGLEAKRVFVLEYSRIEIAMTDEDAALQEKNIHYIALTRSLDELYLVD